MCSLRFYISIFTFVVFSFLFCLFEYFVKFPTWRPLFGKIQLMPSLMDFKLRILTELYANIIFTSLYKIFYYYFALLLQNFHFCLLPFP